MEESASENRIARLMHIHKLVAVQRRKFRATTESKHNWPVAPNILNRNFTTNGLGKIWLTNITYVWTYEGWLYLVFVLELYYRGVVGLSMASRVTDGLTKTGAPEV